MARVTVDPDRTGFLAGAGRSQSLKRAFGLLDCLAAHPEGMSVASLTRESGLPRATVTRLLASLADVGAAARSTNARVWTLGPSLLRLSRALPSIGDLRDRARPLLEEVTAASQETSMLGVPIGPASVQVIDAVEGPRLTSARASGNNSVLTSPASGFVRMVLAELHERDLGRALGTLPFERLTASTIVTADELLVVIEQIRRDDYSVVIDEYEQGLAGVGVPVRSNGTLVALIAVYLPTARFDDATRVRTLSLLRQAAARLGA
jgi:DNA-binding IclR family transcriptional regulator